MIVQLMLLACMLLPSSIIAATSIDPPSPSESVQQRPRIIVFVNRSKEVPGYLEYEDAELILMESLSGVATSYHKDNVLGIARLIDIDEPTEGAIILRNNQKQEGLIVHDEFDSVQVLINGVPLTLPRNRVSHVILYPSLDEQYLQYRLKIDSSDLQAQLHLCRWLMDRQAYDLAQKELQQAWALHQDPESLRLLRLVKAQLELKNQHLEQDQEAIGQSKSEQKGTAAANLITDHEVNLIRVYEIDVNDIPHVLVPRTAIQELIDQYGASGLIPDTEEEQIELLSAESKELVKLMFRLRARDLYDRIEVLGEPASLQLFRERVHDTWLMNNCSTTQCHGGTNSGRFRLIRSGSTTDRTRYTNLLLMERFQLQDGLPLIDWDEPGNSMLIQYGFPRDQTRTPHPNVPGWTPVFKGSRRSLANGTEKWIRSMMNSPRPIYPVGDHIPIPGQPEAPDQP